MSNNESSRKYVFVCGMPRSGTSVLGRNVGRLANCSDFKNTGVLEDEGQFLQDVYPVASKLGGAGSFGFDPRAHRTEASPLLTPENVRRLHSCWHAYWDNSKAIFVEKTPGNLLMTRFLQAAFPNSYFVVIKRHPVPVAMAAQKWKIDMVSLDTGIRHWLHCHDLFESDKSHLRHLYELRYEDYVEDPERYHAEIASFIGTQVGEPAEADRGRRVTQWRNPTGLQVPETAMESTSGAHNAKYFARWTQLLRQGPFMGYYHHLATKYEGRVSGHGYSLLKGFWEGPPDDMAQKTSSGLGWLYCRAADLGAGWNRTVTQTRWHFKRWIKRMLPNRPEASGFQGEKTAGPRGVADAPTSPERVKQLGRFST